MGEGAFEVGGRVDTAEDWEDEAFVAQDEHGEADDDADREVKGGISDAGE